MNELAGIYRVYFLNNKYVESILLPIARVVAMISMVLPLTSRLGGPSYSSKGSVLTEVLADGILL